MNFGHDEDRERWRLGSEALVPLQDERALWLAERRHGIGASESAALFGLHPYTSPWRLWAEKRGVILARPDSLEQRLGRFLESFAAEEVAAATGFRLVDPGRHHLVRHPRHPLVFATVDRLIEMEGSPGLLEIKVLVHPMHATAWREQPPIHVQHQLQHQLEVEQRPWGAIALLVVGELPRLWRYERDEEYGALIVERVETFWAEHVVPGKQPPVDDHDATADALAEAYPREMPGLVVDLPAEAAVWADRLEFFAQMEAGAKRIRQQIKNWFAAVMGPAEKGQLADGTEMKLATVRKEAHVVEATEYRQLRRVRPRQRALRGRRT